MPRHGSFIFAALLAVAPFAFAEDWPQWRWAEPQLHLDQFSDRGPAISSKATVRRDEENLMRKRKP